MTLFQRASSIAKRIPLLIYALLFVLLVFLPASTIHVPSDFNLTLTVTGIRFQTASSSRNAGFFNNTPLDVTVEGFDQIVDVDDKGNRTVAKRRPYQCDFSDIWLTSDMEHPLQVSLSSSEADLRLALTHFPPTQTPIASMKPGNDPVDNCKADLSDKARPSEWVVYGSHESVLLILRPNKETKLVPERGIRLENGSTISFVKDAQLEMDDGNPTQFESSVTESAKGIQLTEINRQVQLVEGQHLEIKNLMNATLERIGSAPEIAEETKHRKSIFGTDAQEQSMEVKVRGRSNEILVDEVNKAATLGELWGSQESLLKFLAFASAIATLLASILTFMQDPSKK